MHNSKNSNSSAGSAVRWIIGCALWFALLFVMVFVVPAQKKTYDEFGMMLPSATQAVVDVSMWFADYWWAVMPAFVAAALVAALVMFFVRHRTNSSVLMALWLLL